MSKAQMWGGRFERGASSLMQEFSESLSFDQALYAQDIAGSQAHARMMAHVGVITREEAETLCRGLDAVKAEIESGAFTWKIELEDVHMNIESRLTELVGEVGKKLHTGRSRNDQVALAFRLFVSDHIREWQNLLRDLLRALADKAEALSGVLLPGLTHTQPAQPVSLSQHLLAYACMFRRDLERLEQCDRRTRVCPLGAAALAGTTYPFDPAFTARELDMYGVFSNSMDAVTDRDFALEALFTASCLMMHLSRLCEDVIMWAHPAHGYVRLPDTFATGSSIMPQKKNPDAAEIMRGKTGRVYGDLMALLTVMKGLPLTYNRDQQEDKEPFLDADRTVRLSLAVMAAMLRDLAFVPEAMREALARGFLNATELADYLVGKGIPFREAHHLTGAAVALAEKDGLRLEELRLDALQSICPNIGAGVYDILKPEAAVARRETIGGTGPRSTLAQLAELRRVII